MTQDLIERVRTARSRCATLGTGTYSPDMASLLGEVVAEFERLSSPPEEVVERVARALWGQTKLIGCSKGFHEGASDPFESADAETQTELREYARAAIAVMSSLRPVPQDLGADPALVASPSSPQAVSTKGFDPGAGA